ncbi:MAG: ABC transporter permease [Bacteroidia bacterium]|nr:ABC transporter permease [Bacteroidia bacterium]
MFDLDKWQEIFHTLGKKRLRAILTGFGVFWGIYMLVILLGSGSGLENGVSSMFSFSKNSVFLWTNRTTMPYKGYKSNRYVNLTTEDMEAIVKLSPEIEYLSPRIGRGTQIMNRKGKSGGFNLQGDFPDLIKIAPMEILEGRFINEIDIKESRKVAFIGTRVRDVLFEEGEDPVGDYIEISGLFFKVIGVFESMARGEDARRDAQRVYIPTPTMQRVFNMGNNIGWMAMTPKPGVSPYDLEDKVRGILGRRKSVHPDDEGGIRSNNLQKEFAEFQNMFAGIRGFSWFVACMAIIAGMVGLANIMMITVKERTRELGIRKALGATPWSIVSMIISETMFLCLVSGYLGMILGIFSINGMAMIANGAEIQYFYNPEVKLSVITTSMVLLVITGFIAGLAPALKAARLKPTYALSDE